MKILDIRDIDFNELEMLDVLSSESTLYYDEKLFYKLYDNLQNIQRKEKKILLLNDGNNEFDAVIPHILIKNRLITYGCAMERIKNTNSLIKYKKSDIFILLLYAVSLSLKKIHNDPRNIVVGDLHFNNILIDNKGRHHFIDFDSCMIDGIPHDRIPNNFMEYVGNRGNFEFKVGQDTDKLCMILSFINSLFGKGIDSLSIDEYDEKAEKIYTLKNLRDIVLGIKNNSFGIPCVPYLHEIISIRDFPGTKRVRNIS